MIVYTHLGRNGDCRQVIAQETQEALRNLEREYRDGNIYVTTTSKLLNYYYAHQHLIWSHHQNGGEIQISIDHLDDPAFGLLCPRLEQLQGLTFCVPDAARTTVYLRGAKVEYVRRNPSDESGAESVTLPFTQLSFPY